jgi:hypothetical protein|tara:strand:+ start:2450 stop:3094 length:645 start_codon:yes stop_codon:yes gene_type:complete
VAIDWSSYESQGVWDELVTGSGRAHPGAGSLMAMLRKLSEGELIQRKSAAEIAIRAMGITFTVYTGEGSGSIDREWPFDIIPRLIRKAEWDAISLGLKQRVIALNHFIDDVYHDQKALKDGVLPRSYKRCLTQVRTSLRSLPRHDLPLRTVNRMPREIAAQDVSALEGEDLCTFTHECQLQLATLHDVIDKTYFTFRPRRRPQPKIVQRKASKT